MYKTRHNLQCRKNYIYIYKYIKMLNKYRAVSEQKWILSDLLVFKGVTQAGEAGTGREGGSPRAAARGRPALFGTGSRRLRVATATPSTSPGRACARRRKSRPAAEAGWEQGAGSTSHRSLKARRPGWLPRGRPLAGTGARFRLLLLLPLLGVRVAGGTPVPQERHREGWGVRGKWSRTAAGPHSPPAAAPPSGGAAPMWREPPWAGPRECAAAATPCRWSSCPTRTSSSTSPTTQVQPTRRIAQPSAAGAPRALGEGSEQPRLPSGKGLCNTRAGFCRASQKDEASGVVLPRLTPPLRVSLSQVGRRRERAISPQQCVPGAGAAAQGARKLLGPDAVKHSQSKRNEAADVCHSSVLQQFWLLLRWGTSVAMLKTCQYKARNISFRLCCWSCFEQKVMQLSRGLSAYILPWVPWQPTKYFPVAPLL